MMDISFESLSRGERYHLLNGIVVPRPIAWITSKSEAGVVNLAPFSTFNIVSYEPPLVGVNMLLNAQGKLKDSTSNLLASKEFVVNIGSEEMVSTIHKSAYPYPPEVAEPEVLGLSLLQSVDVAPPRLADAPLSMECRLHHVVELSEDGSKFMVGRVLRLHARDGLINDGQIDSALLRPAFRLGGAAYGTLGNIVVPK